MQRGLHYNILSPDALDVVVVVRHFVDLTSQHMAICSLSPQHNAQLPRISFMETTTKTVLWSRTEVAARILKGDTLIVYRGHLLSIPSKWLNAHPGGTLALLHFVGRDATDEIEANHQDATVALVSKYSVGRVELTDGVWEPFLPPIAAGWTRRRDTTTGEMRWYKDAEKLVTMAEPGSTPSVLLVERHAPRTESISPLYSCIQPPASNLSLKQQVRQSMAYRELHKRIRDAGLYNTRYITGYGPELLRYASLATISAYAYVRGYFITSAIFLGLVWHQLSFTAHDLGHMGVTHVWVLDRIMATIVANFIGGLSIGWWVHNHNVHHLVTNHPSHDPDIEYLPFFAITPTFLKSLWSSYYKRSFRFDFVAKMMLQVQHKLFYVIMLFARFNLYINSYIFLYKNYFDTKRAKGGDWAWKFEIIGILFFWAWYGRVLYGCGSWKMALLYLVVSHVATSPLHVQLVLSHFTMSTADLGPGESFAHRQLRTTTDVICDKSIEFMHGGLHLQVTHHLFPRLPRHNLRLASELVKQFAKDEGLAYSEFGFVEGNYEVLGTLRHVANQVKIIGRVAKAEVDEALEKRLLHAQKG
ncbi:delta 8-sphingoloid desaturase protein [Agrocybe pediades]|nr:delta 8-sphingoloid desaturase protein [Agrocybe pediades]